MFRNPTTDLLVVLVIVLLLLGPKRLPSLGRSLGQGMREFKESITGESKHDDEGQRPEIGHGAAPAQQPAGGAQERPAERPSAEVGSDRS